MKLETLYSYRAVHLFLLLASIGGMAFAFFLQYVVELEPCPLCMLQRVGLVAMGAFALMALIHNPKTFLFRRGYALLTLISILWSAGVAGRHVWLQNLPPDKVPSCGAGLEYLMETFPLMTVLQEVLSGSGECAVIDWTLLGLSLPMWSLIFFSALTGICVWQLFRAYPR